MGEISTDFLRLLPNLFFLSNNFLYTRYFVLSYSIDVVSCLSKSNTYSTACKFIFSYLKIIHHRVIHHWYINESAAIKRGVASISAPLLSVDDLFFLQMCRKFSNYANIVKFQLLIILYNLYIDMYMNMHMNTLPLSAQLTQSHLCQKIYFLYPMKPNGSMEATRLRRILLLLTQWTFAFSTDY